MFQCALASNAAAMFTASHGAAESVLEVGYVEPGFLLGAMDASIELALGPGSADKQEPQLDGLSCRCTWTLRPRHTGVLMEVRGPVAACKHMLEHRAQWCQASSSTRSQHCVIAPHCLVFPVKHAHLMSESHSPLTACLPCSIPARCAPPLGLLFGLLSSRSACAPLP